MKQKIVKDLPPLPVMIENLIAYEDFEILREIGKGAYGIVYLVKKKNTGEIFAMKELSKNVIIDNDQVELVRLERDILKMDDHPFMANMKYVFQTEEEVYFVMKFVKGGDLFNQLLKAENRRFPEEVVRFYIIQIALALGHLHKKNILYRDLKTENILMDADGYLCLTDFGMATVLSEEKIAA